MNLHQSEKEYLKIEFTSVVFKVKYEFDITLKEAFSYCFLQAKKHKIKTGFYTIEDKAYNQFVYFIKINKYYFE
jgi:hypothetical protein